MPALAATATTTALPTGTLMIFLLILTTGYSLLCAVWPYRRCPRCHGLGRFAGPLRGIRLCHRCDGTGLTLRAGRRFWRAVRRSYREIKPRNHNR